MTLYKTIKKDPIVTYIEKKIYSSYCYILITNLKIILIEAINITKYLHFIFVERHFETFFEFQNEIGFSL